MPTLAERFTDKVSPEPNTGCWLWTAAAHRNGYGGITISARLDLAHRVSWALYRGAIPAGLFVCHRCDVRSCVNPDHLFLGTAQDNNVDMVAKGRHGSVTHPEAYARGHRNGSWTQPDRRARGDRHGSRTRPDRVLRGASHGRAKLTDADVRAIRAAYTGARGEQCRLAAIYHIGPSQLNYIVRQKSWRQA